MQPGRSQAREAAEASASAKHFASTPFLASAFFPQWLPAIEHAAGHRVSFQFLVDHMQGCERLMRRGEIRMMLCHHHGPAPVAYLAYSPESGVGRILSRSRLIERVQDRLRPAFHSHAVLTLATIAQARRGFAWLPWSAVEQAVSAGSLVRAANEDWDVPPEICLIRPRARQGAILGEFWLQAREHTLDRAGA